MEVTNISSEISDDEIALALKENSSLRSVIAKYVKVSTAKTGVRDINQIEYDICAISKELNQVSLHSWLDKQQKDAELALRMQKPVKRSGKKNSLGILH